MQIIFQWASEGNTAAEITRKLYAMNIPIHGEYRKLKGKDYYNVSRTNGVWSTSTVLHILEDQRYKYSFKPSCNFVRVYIYNFFRFR